MMGMKSYLLSIETAYGKDAYAQEGADFETASREEVINIQETFDEREKPSRISLWMTR
ncbi:MAG: hypothetical protein M2R45_05364 [Verrucomicrobia subdivision 3 bacterium]|nr:hypothetical protein [Limisphaerales bacterium]MCS1417109.1 hypothetical protein [Limisphaerales bacterium]